MRQTPRHLLLSACLAAGALLAACGGGGGGAADSGGGAGGGGGATNPLSGEYQPMSVGDRRFYRVDGVVTSTHVVGTRDTSYGSAFVVRTEDQEGLSEGLVQRTSDGVWTLPNDPGDLVDTALGRIQALRLPLVPGDSYEVLDRTLSNIKDFDDDRRPDTLRVVIRVSISGPETLTVAGKSLTHLARVRTEVTQTFTLSTETEPFTAQTVVEEWLAPDVGSVAINNNTRVDGRLLLTSSALGLAWRVGGRPSETVAPTVVSVSPADGSVLQRATPHVIFSEEMDRFAADDRAMVLVHASGVEVQSTLTWQSDRELQLQPSVALMGGEWQLRLGSSLQDLIGNPVSASATWRFTIDDAGPQAVSRFPEPGSSNVAANTAIRIVFDEALGSFATAGGLVSLTTDVGGYFEGTLTKEGDRTLVFTPTSDLPPGRRVQVSVFGVPDILGNPAARQAWSFDVELGRFAAPVNLPSLSGLGDGLTALESRAASDGSGRAELLTISLERGVTFTPVLSRLRFDSDGSPGSAEALQTLTPGCTNTGLVLADLDGDGIRDAVVSSASPSGSTAACGLHSLRGRADGGFSAPVALHLGSGGPAHILPHAVHGRPTLVMPLDDARLLVLRQGATPGTWLAPLYVSMGPTALPGRWNSFLAAGDVNGDGRVDLVAMVRQSSTFGFERQLLLQTADGSLGEALLQVQAGTAGLSAVALGDLNGDGRDDLVLQVDASLAWLASGADGTFGAAQTLGGTYNAHAQRIADVDGDGLRDLLFWQHGTGLRAMFRLAGGGLGPPQTLLFGVTPTFASLLTVADFDGDRLPDIATGSFWLRQRPPAGGSSAEPAAAASATVASAARTRQPAALARPGFSRFGAATERVLRARSPVTLADPARGAQLR